MRSKITKIKKSRKNKKFISLYLKQSPKEQKKLEIFFSNLENRLLVVGRDKKLLRWDFENAFIEYFSMGISLDHSLELLDLTNLGGFYSRNSDLWLPLDEVGKSYTQFLDRNNMAVFREAFYLKERVRPEILQIALNFTIKRFPYFAMCVKKGFFWHYLDSIRRRFKIEKENALPVQRIPISISGSKTFRVLYYENRISVEFFHCITDGTGAKEFLKSLVQTYLKLIDKNIKDSDLVINVNSDVKSEEYENEFLNIKRINTPEGYVNKKALQLSGSVSNRKPCRVLHFRINTSDLKSAARKYDVGINAYISTIIFFACKHAIDELKGDISITLPVNMRNCHPSNTLRNFSLYICLRKPIDQISDFATVCKEAQENLKSQTCKDTMLQMAGATAGLMNNIRYLPLPLKVFGTRTLYKLFGDNIFTVAFSNLGICELPDDMAKEITGMDFVLGTSFINRAQVSAVTVNGVTCISVSKYTMDPSFEEKMYELFKKDGLDISVEGSEYNGN